MLSLLLGDEYYEKSFMEKSFVLSRMIQKVLSNN
jgi:hypothetical protein